MSSTASYDKTTPESRGGATPSKPPRNFFRIDLILRLFVFASTVSALVVLVTSKDTETISTGLLPPLAFLTRDAEFNHSPALMYLPVALSIAVLYSILTIISSCSLLSKPAPSTKILFNLIVFDASQSLAGSVWRVSVESWSERQGDELYQDLNDELIAGILASAVGSAASVAYLGLRGNSHTNWNKICDVYGKFCRHIGASTAVTLAATCALILLVALSSHTLYRRSR